MEGQDFPALAFYYYPINHHIIIRHPEIFRKNGINASSEKYH